MKEDRGSQPVFRPEHELILCCARAHLRPEAAERIPALLRQDLDWKLLATTAVHQKIDPLVYSKLCSAPAGTIPTDWMEFFQDFSRDSAAINLNLTAHLFRILEIFHSNGIVAIPYKGPILAALAYGNLSLRRFIDLDLLVRQSDVAKAAKVLASKGYQTEGIEGFLANRNGKHIPGQYFFRSNRDASLFELHTERTLRYFPKPLDMNELEKRLVPVSLGNKIVPSLPREDLVCFLCVHGTKHLWNRLQWIFDVAALTHPLPVEDWERIEERATKMECMRMVHLGLYLANEFFNSSIPGDTLRRIEADRAIPRMAAVVGQQFFREGRKSHGVLQRAAFRIRAVEGPWKGIRYSAGLALRPTEEDWSSVRLPVGLSFFYPLFRPIHLLRKYGIGARRGPMPDLAPYVPTPPEVVDRMLDLAEIRRGDVLYDLGCGDGRIAIAVAKRYGIRSVGVDLDLERIRECKKNVRREGLQHLVRFIQQDVKTIDVYEATVIALYLTSLGVMVLKDKLKSQLRPGARIVSRNYLIAGWTPDECREFELPDGQRTVLWLYRIEQRARPKSDRTDPCEAQSFEQESDILAAGKTDD